MEVLKCQDSAFVAYFIDELIIYILQDLLDCLSYESLFCCSLAFLIIFFFHLKPTHQPRRHRHLCLLKPNFLLSHLKFRFYYDWSLFPFKFDFIWQTTSGLFGWVTTAHVLERYLWLIILYFRSFPLICIFVVLNLFLILTDLISRKLPIWNYFSLHQEFSLRHRHHFAGEILEGGDAIFVLVVAVEEDANVSI